MASANQPEFAWLLESGIEDIEARRSPPTNGGSRLRLLALVPVALFSLFATGHTKPGTVLDGGWLQLSESLFEPVDGGLDRACRGASSNDNQGWYFNVVSAADLASCQLMCLETVGCAGVEYADAINRCEIWTRPEGIQASRSSQGSVCFRRVGVFEPVDGGIERACRGSNAYDNSPSYFEVRVVQLLQDCQKECLQTPQCTGIEFSIGRCEVWTRPEGIEASIALPGFSCYRAESFATTLTATSSMTSTATFTSFSTSATSTATSTATMTGTSTTVTTDTATTTGTITATSTATSTTPLATTPASTVPTTDVFFRGIDGGVDRVCRGATSTDNNPAYYDAQMPTPLPRWRSVRICARRTQPALGWNSVAADARFGFAQMGSGSPTVPLALSVWRRWSGAPWTRARAEPAGATRRGTTCRATTRCKWSLESCQQLCLASEACQGVEYSPVRCELWSHSIWSSISLANFQCYRLVNRKREAFIAEVTANTWPVLGFDAECRGSSSEEDLAQHKGVVQAASLQRCQERCLENTLCQGVEYHLGRCELWIRPEGIGSTANAENHICMGRPSSLPPGEVQTKYVVHYMPWFLSREGGFYDHWCVGNAHYESVFGTYNLSDRDIVRQQLDLMKNSSIDGLWIDYQLASWNAVVDVIMEETAARGMGVAIVIDDAVNPNIFAEVGTKMIEWTSFSHYYRHGGIPIVPVFNTANAIFTPLPFEAYYMARRELARPDWANGTYPWIAETLEWLERYYEDDHGLSSFAVGSAYRGFRDCYSDRVLAPGFLEMLEPSLNIASKYQPKFVQVLTWNDYSEGTQVEPSWVRVHGTCLSACSAEKGASCRTCYDCASGHDFLDCTKPYGAAEGPVDPWCNSSAVASAASDLELLAQHIRAEAEGTWIPTAASSTNSWAQPVHWYSRDHQARPQATVVA